jgi:DHA2 family multidrug resistance protein
MFNSLSKLRERIVARAPALQPENSAYPWLALAATSIPTFMAMLDTTIVNVAINKLTVAFGVSTDATEWVVTGYMLAFCVTLPASGWLADHFGYKRIFIIGIALFTIGAFLQGLSWSMGVLIFFRVIQAVGGGLVQPLSMAIIAIEFPPKKRNLALGFWAIASAASISLGPTLGGYLIDNYSWQSIFDVNVPFGLIGLPAVALVMREHKAETTQSFDFLGLISMAVFLCGLNLGLAEGNAAWNTDGWTSQFILSCFGVSALGFMVFIANELSVEHPLVDLRLFKNREFALSNLVLLMFGIGMFGSIFLFPLYLQICLRYTPLQSGMVSLPMGFITALISPLAGAMCGKTGNRILLGIGLFFMALSFYLNSLLTLSSEIAQIIVPICLRGIGFGFIFSPLQALAISGIRTDEMAQASGLTNVTRQIGGSIGVAWFGSMLTSQIKVHLAGLGQNLGLYSASFRNTVSHLMAFAIKATGGTASSAQEKAESLFFARLGKLAYVESISYIFIIATVLVLASIIPLFFMQEARRKS